MTPPSECITFEQPLTERVRTFLRLEFLFAQHHHHRAKPNVPDMFESRATLHALLDILTVLSRSDLKNDILKELSDRHSALTKLTARPDVDQARLSEVLAEITQAVNGVQQRSMQFATSILRDHEFLNAVLNRSTIAGGTCGFDLPLYHWWLSQPFAAIQRDLDGWYTDIRPFEQAILLYLRLLRQSVAAQPVAARGGIYMAAPQSPCSLLRVHVPLSANVYPEISAGKHRFTVRFMSVRDIHSRPSQASDDVPFELQTCNL